MILTSDIEGANSYDFSPRVKVLILVLSARRDPWGLLMDTQMETWDAEEHPQTRTLYYCGKGGESTEKVFYSPGLTESLEDISSRTIEAFEHAASLPDWDYLARPHSSTYVHKRNLVQFCEAAPRENTLYGCYTEGDKRFLWGGCHYIFTRDVIEKMVANKEKWDSWVMDDQSITALAEFLEVNVLPAHSATINLVNNGYNCIVYGHGENFDFNNFEDVGEKAGDHFFFRVKQDCQRHQDLHIMRELKRCLK